MTSRIAAALLAASWLSPPVAWAQAGHEAHHGEAQKAPAKPADKPPAKPAAGTPAKPAAGTPAKIPSAPASAIYRSAFEGYRPFDAEEPVLDWRAANEAVREAGGHIGIMKNAQPAPAKK